MSVLWKSIAPLTIPLAAGISYLLRDEFTTAQAAPLTSPRTCEPGPGTLTITDPGNKISTLNSQLTFSNSYAGEATVRSQTFARQAGLCCSFLAVNVSGVEIAGGWVGHYFYYTYFGQAGDFCILGVKPSTSGKTHFILRSTGCFYVSNGVLMYVTNLYSTDQSIYLRDGASTAFVIDSLSVAQLGTPWTSDYGIATNRIASPAVGDTTTSEANHLVEFTWTATTGATLDLMVRYTDDNNCWIVRCGQAGSTVKLIEKSGGVETERSSVAQTWTNNTAYRIVVISDGNTIKTYVANVAKNSYASASFNNTATGVKTSAAGSNLIAWPRTLSGAALAELNKV